MFLSSHRSLRIYLFMFILGSCLLLPACTPENSRAAAEIDQTAIAAVVKTVNAAAPPVIASPTVSPTIPTGNTMETFDKIIRFSGQEWRVKSSGQPVGPGPNHFSNDPGNVWVDGSGQLHLKITYKNGKWYCAEVVTVAPLGYGSYQFKVSSSAGGIDKDAVLGLFTWDTSAPQYNYREIDIELSRWGEEMGLNAQFVVQPWDRPGNRHRFAIDRSAGSSTYIFVWSPKSVQFLSFIGEAPSPDPSNIANQWLYTGRDIPPAGGSANARINLWLIGGHPPSDGKEIEVVLSSFDYIPGELTK